MSVGSEMRCPKCNKHLPDRCICNGPSAEDRRAAPIAAQLDQDAERADFEAWTRADIGMPENVPFNWDSHWAKAALEGWMERARRAVPVAAQLDAELPPLPRSIADMRTGGLTVEPGYTAEQYRQGQREAQVAALAKYCGADAGGTQLITRLMTETNDLRSKNVEYAERIRLLDHEAITQKLANQVLRDRVAFLESERNLMEANRRAYIDGRTAGTAPEGWQLVPVEPTMAMIAALGYEGDEMLAIGHGLISQGIAEQYKAALAAAPSPQENTNG